MKQLLIMLAVWTLAPMALFAQSIQSIYSFTDGNDGANQYAGLTLGPDGNFYGTTSGGTSSHGTVFRLATNGDVSPLYSFIGGISGASPYAALTLAPLGNFYGTTEGGTNGNGTVFQMATNG